MADEIELFGNVFEGLAREVLDQLDNLPGQALHWPLPLPQSDTLCTRVLRLIEENAFWVIEVVGGRAGWYTQLAKRTPRRTRADLHLYYNQWLYELHRVLDTLPTDFLDTVVIVPPYHQMSMKGKTMTVRACLLYAIEQTALAVGQIQFICQLFADGERVLQEVIESREYCE